MVEGVGHGGIVGLVVGGGPARSLGSSGSGSRAARVAAGRFRRPDGHPAPAPPRRSSCMVGRRFECRDAAGLLGPLAFRWTTVFREPGGPTAFKWSNRMQVVQAGEHRHEPAGDSARRRPAPASPPDEQPSRSKGSECAVVDLAVGADGLMVDGPETQKGGRRAPFTLRPASLPSPSGAMTPFFRHTRAAAHSKATRQPPFRPADAPDRDSGGTDG